MIDRQAGLTISWKDTFKPVNVRQFGVQWLVYNFSVFRFSMERRRCKFVDIEGEARAHSL